MSSRTCTANPLEYSFPDPAGVGTSMHALMRELYPICRSITGRGARDTLAVISESVPLELTNVPSGTHVLDWTVPPEWNVRDAYIAKSSGERVIDFHNSNLHVVNYSSPVRKTLPLSELKGHLHTLPDYPDAVPYLTSYYSRNWGFCLTQQQFDSLEDDEYDVLVDASLEDGSLTYGEYLIAGESTDEILVSTYICHPSLCNDNLSGIVLAVHLAQHLSGRQLRYSYRFLFVPETIGAIAWLANNPDAADRIRYGFVATCVGDPGHSTYQKTRAGNTELDQAILNVLNQSGSEFKVREFVPYGSDERQYSSPGFDIPVGLLMRTPYGQFPEYHTSADNLEFVRPEALGDSFSKYVSAIYLLENNRTYVNTNPKGEPQFSKRGLHKPIGGRQTDAEDSLALYWVLNLSDGQHSLLDVSDRSGLRFDIIKHAADRLLEAGLLESNS